MWRWLMHLHLLLFSLLLTTTSSAELLFGRNINTYARFLATKGFLCAPFGATQGFRCQGRIQYYPKLINIFIPERFNPSKDYSLLYHFHGFYLDPQQNPFNLEGGDGDFPQMITESQTSTLIVVPESTGRCDTYDSYFTSPEKTELFFLQVRNLLPGDPQQIMISGHSGADSLLGQLGLWASQRKVGTLGAVMGVASFDSLYNDDALPGHKAWRNLMVDKGGIFYAAYNHRDCNPTCRDRRYRSVWDKIVPGLFLQRSTHEHMEFMKFYMPEFLLRMNERILTK